MDIHKPKPWRGVREFLKEIGTIVIGVLIALGAEQAVETFHKSQELHETRDALRDEIARNATTVRINEAQDTCRIARLDQLQAWAEGGPKPKPSPTSGVFVLSFSVWEVAKAGPLAKMPLNERLKYSALYDTFQNVQQNLLNQISDGLELAQFLPLAKLAPNQSQRMVETINRDRVTLRIKLINETQIDDEVKVLGIRARPISAEGRRLLGAMCEAAGVSVPEV
jgi:hypothetical protein